MEVKMHLLVLLVCAIFIGSSDALTCYSSLCTSQTCGSGDSTTSGCTSCQLVTAVASMFGVSTTTFARSCLMTTQTTGCSTTSLAGVSTTLCYCNTDNCNADQNTVQPTTTTTTTTPAPRGNTATPLTAATAATAALLTLSTTLILSL